VFAPKTDLLLHLVQSYALLTTRLLNVRGAWTAATGSKVAVSSAVDSEPRLVMINALTPLVWNLAMLSTIADTPRQHRSENKLENPLKINQLQISVRNYGRFQIAIAFLPSHLNMRAYRE
jgi:hypothetical protein